jgi:hypothetical protein
MAKAAIIALSQFKEPKEELAKREEPAPNVDEAVTSG